MDTNIIVAIVLFVCAAGIIGVKVYQSKQKNQSYNFDNFIADYGNNIIKLLEQTIEILTTKYNPEAYESQEDYENAIICEAIDYLKGHCADFDIPEYIINLLDTEKLAELITDIFYKNKIEIYSAINVLNVQAFDQFIDSDIVNAVAPATELDETMGKPVVEGEDAAQKQTSTEE